jgi:hypothetical protein
MMRTIIVLNILISLGNLNAQSQSILGLECKYNYLIINNSDTEHITKTVWITDKLIFEFDDSDSSSCALYNFETNTLNIKRLERSHYNNIEEGRLKAKLSTSPNFQGIKLEVNDAVHDLIYLDTSVRIPYFKSGDFGNFLDNGLGFLPVNYERSYLDKDNNTRTTIITLLSKEPKMIDTRKFNID